MIFYFSGTGNSAYVAKRVAKVTGDEAINLLERLRNKDFSAVKSQRPVVIVAPTYSWRIPKLVENWLEKTSFLGTKNVYFLLTCGSEIGNAPKYIEKLCAEKKWKFMGCGEIVMPENYIAMFNAPEEKEALEIIQRSKPIIDKFADLIARQEPIPRLKANMMKKASSLINPVFYALFVKDKKFFASNDCVGCEKCKTLCPMNNIEMVGGKPKWRGNCTHCMACICACPKEAIEYGKISVGKPKYQCPEGME